MLRLDLDPSTALLGINNRDLQTFEVTLENTRIIMESAAGTQVSIRPFGCARMQGVSCVGLFSGIAR